MEGGPRARRRRRRPRELCAILLDTGDRADTVLARRAAVAALRRLAATGDLRAAMSPQLNLRALVDAARPNPNELARAAGTTAHWETRADALEILHACMDPARNPHAAPVRASVAGEGVPARRYGAPRKRSSPPRGVRPRPPPPSPPRCGASRISPRTSTRREEMSSNAELLGVFVATLRDETGASFEPKAAAAAALCRLAGAAPARSKQTSPPPRSPGNSSGISARSNPRGRVLGEGRGGARGVEGAIGRGGASVERRARRTGDERGGGGDGRDEDADREGVGGARARAAVSPRGAAGVRTRAGTG